MKTAMKEVVEELIKLRGFNFKITDEYLQGLLEKEKQQLFHCFNNAADEINEKRFNEWFNQTYNQNK